MFCGALVIVLTMAMPSTWAASFQFTRHTSPLKFDEKTVLVYENEAGAERHQFVLRIARFRPDIFLEWESLNHQGTIHLRKKAVAGSKRLTVGGLFEAGVDVDSKNVMTNWFSVELFRQLVQGGEANVHLNKHKIKLRLAGEESRHLIVDGVDAKVPVIRIEDNQKGTWIVNKDPNNPVLIEYQSPHYHMRLKRISTSKSNNLRWIRQLPPVK